MFEKALFYPTIDPSGLDTYIQAVMTAQQTDNPEIKLYYPQGAVGVFHDFNLGTRESTTAAKIYFPDEENPITQADVVCMSDYPLVGYVNGSGAWIEPISTEENYDDPATMEVESMKVNKFSPIPKGTKLQELTVIYNYNIAFDKNGGEGKMDSLTRKNLEMK